MLLGAAPSSAFDNWTTLRDEGVVKQAREYSCGVAALATLITHYYADVVSERQLLDRLISRDREQVLRRQSGVSFADLAWLARTMGYDVVGLSLRHEDFMRLRRPVIVRLEREGDTHFTVLRGVDGQGAVLLADPSWGRVRLSRWQFHAAMGADAAPVLLLAAPSAAEGDNDYFRRDISAAVRLPRDLVSPAP